MTELVIIVALFFVGLFCYGFIQGRKEERARKEQPKDGHRRIQDIIREDSAKDAPKNADPEKQARLKALLESIKPEALEDEQILKDLQHPDAKGFLLDCSVAGVTFEGRQTKIRKIQDFLDDVVDHYSIHIRLTREPENRHDPNAIKVLTWAECEKYNERTDTFREVKKNIGHIGFVPKEQAAKLAPLMDSGRFLYATFDSLSEFENEKGKTVIAVKIKIDVPLD